MDMRQCPVKVAMGSISRIKQLFSYFKLMVVTGKSLFKWLCMSVWHFSYNRHSYHYAEFGQSVLEACITEILSFLFIFYFLHFCSTYQHLVSPNVVIDIITWGAPKCKLVDLVANQEWVHGWGSILKVVRHKICLCTDTLTICNFQGCLIWPRGEKW